MKRVNFGRLLCVLWLSVLLRAAFPGFREHIGTMVRQGLDPKSLCMDTIAAMGENLTQLGLHKTIMCIVDSFDEKLFIPVFSEE